MAIRVSDRLIAKSRGSAETAVAYLRKHNAKRLDEAEACVREVYRLCSGPNMPDASIVVARMADETGGDGPEIFVSKPWNDHLNPGGFGVTPGEVAADFPNGVAGARAMVAHTLLYATGTIDRGGLSSADDPRFQAYRQAFGQRAAATTLQGLEGTWFTLIGGAQNSANRGNAIFPGIEDQEGEISMGNRPKVIVDAGHRSTDRSGNPAEMALTGFMAAAYVDELRRRGYDAQWFQRDVDGDPDADETVGDLDTVGSGIAKWLRNTPGDLLFISCHYNGAHSPLHAIVPDNVGLTTRVQGGAPAGDTAANNILDVKVATAIMRHMQQAGLGTLFNGKLGVAGLMSETESGVGLDGFRLAVFAYTADSRDRAVRLVIEHGGTGDDAARRQDFTERCATAAVDALDEVYGGPVPGDVQGERKEIPDPVEDKEFDGRFYVVAERKRRTALVDVTAREKPSTAAGTVGDEVKKGDTVTLQYVTAGDDGKPWLVSKRGSHFPAAAFVPDGA